MRVVVLGAAGGVGRQAVRLAAERGHEVVAVARGAGTDAAGTDGTAADAAGTGPAVTRLTGDVRDADLLARAVAGADAVLWCVGVTRRSGGDVGRTAVPLLVDAMTAAGVRRFVGVSGAGAYVPGERKTGSARLVSALTRRLARDVVEDKEGEYAALAASSLDWTQVRPPRLVDRPGTGRYLLTDTAPGLRSAALPKADVAAAMLDLAEGREHLSAAPFVVAAP